MNRTARGLQNYGSFGDESNRCHPIWLGPIWLRSAAEGQRPPVRQRLGRPRAITFQKGLPPIRRLLSTLHTPPFRRFPAWRRWGKVETADPPAKCLASRSGRALATFQAAPSCRLHLPRASACGLSPWAPFSRPVGPDRPGHVRGKVGARGTDGRRSGEGLGCGPIQSAKPDHPACQATIVRIWLGKHVFLPREQQAARLAYPERARRGSIERPRPAGAEAEFEDQVSGSGSPLLLAQAHVPFMQ